MVRRASPVAGLEATVGRALLEDRFRQDRTTRAVLPHRVRATGTITAQATGTVSGVRAVVGAARRAGLQAQAHLADGAPVRPGRAVVTLRGDARRILAVERTLLNVLMHASGIATQTARAVRAVRGTHPPLEIWATRKTLPGLRDLEKAAVVDGGGHAHRRDLSDAVLIKNNHLALVPLAIAVRRARARYGARAPLEVEVRSVRDARAAADAGATALLVDNASPARARSVVRMLEVSGRRSAVRVELSGGITPRTVARYRRVGADVLSLGSLTHSAAALPFHLTVVPSRLSRRTN